MSPQAPEQAAGRTNDTDLGSLPEWDLKDLYPGPDSPELKAALDSARSDAGAFEQRHKGRLAGLDGAALAAAVEAYERIDEVLSRVMSYASLLHAGDMTSPERGRFYQAMQEQVTAISTQLLFFTLEINRLDDAALEAKLAAPALARYGPWLRDTRVFRPHQLSDELEKLLHEKHVVGRAAWVRLFDESMAALRFPCRGRDLTSAEILHLLSDKGPAVRRDAAAALARCWATMCGCSPTSRIRWPRTMRSRIRGARSPGRYRAATSPTMSRTRSSTPWSRRCAAPCPTCRTATMA